MVRRLLALRPRKIINSQLPPLAFSGNPCYTYCRRYFLCIRKGAPHCLREQCGSIFFIAVAFAAHNLLPTMQKCTVLLLRHFLRH